MVQFRESSLHRVRFVFAKNASIEEASGTAFQKCMGKASRTSSTCSLQKGTTKCGRLVIRMRKSAVSSMRERLSSDVHDYLQRSTKRAFKILFRSNGWNMALVAVIIIISA